MNAKRRKKRRAQHGVLKHGVPPKNDNHPVAGVGLCSLLKGSRRAACGSGKNVDGTEGDGAVRHSLASDGGQGKIICADSERTAHLGVGFALFACLGMRCLFVLLPGLLEGVAECVRRPALLCKEQGKGKKQRL